MTQFVSRQEIEAFGREVYEALPIQFRDRLPAGATPYPCHLEEGTLAGVCAAFKAQRPTYQLLTTPTPKREGGTRTVYEVKFLPKR